MPEKWQPSGARAGGTYTDPIWADIVVAFLLVFAAVLVAVVLWSALRVVIRRAQQNAAVRRYRREAEAARWARTGLL